MGTVAWPKRELLYVIILFFVSLGIRAAVYHGYLKNDNRYWQVDSNTYHRVAQGIVANKSISLPDGTPNFYRLPGYPLFVSFFYNIFGSNPEKFLWVQVILASCIPILIFFLTRVLFPTQSLLAMITGAYSSLHLGFVLYSGFFMTESLFMFLFLLFCLFFFRSVHLWFCSMGTKNNIFFAGLFLGLASLVRPVGHYILIIALLVIIFSNDIWQKKVRKSLMFFIAWLLPVSVWLIRNYFLAGHLFFHTLPGGHFLYLSAARVVMHVDQNSYQEARDKLHAQVRTLLKQKETELGRKLHEIESCYVHELLALHYFLSYPCIAIKLWLTDMMRTCLSLYSAELLYLENGRKSIDYFDKNRSTWSLFKRYLVPQINLWWLRCIIYTEIFLFLMIIIGFVYGLITLFFSVASLSTKCSWLICFPFIFLFIIVALAGGYARMRLPIEPFLIIFSLHTWLSLCKSVRTINS